MTGWARAHQGVVVLPGSAVLTAVVLLYGAAPVTVPLAAGRPYPFVVVLPTLVGLLTALCLVDGAAPLSRLAIRRTWPWRAGWVTVVVGPVLGAAVLMRQGSVDPLTPSLLTVGVALVGAVADGFRTAGTAAAGLGLLLLSGLTSGWAEVLWAPGRPLLQTLAALTVAVVVAVHAILGPRVRWS